MTANPNSLPPVPPAQPVQGQPPATRPASASSRVRRPAIRTANTQAPAKSPTPPAAPAAEQNKRGAHVIRDLLIKKRDAIAAIIPEGFDVTADRLIANAMRSVIKDRKLALCSPSSVYESVLGCAALALDFVSGMAFLIPLEIHLKDPTTGREYSGGYRCCLWTGYKGDITVAARAGYIIDAQEVRQNDEIEIFKGTDNLITHREADGDRGEMTKVYCVVRDQQMRVVRIETMDRKDLDQVKKDTDCWVDYEGEMARKSVVRRGVKWLPKDNKFVKLISEINTRAESGQGIGDLFDLTPETETTTATTPAVPAAV